MMDMFKKTTIDYLNGYLNALVDMDCKQGKNTTRAFIKKADNTKDEDFIKEKFSHMGNINLEKEKSYSDNIALYYFIDKMTFLNPCCFFESSGNKQEMIMQKINYRRYVISHLIDYLDFVFDEADTGYVKYDYISIKLFKNDKESFISLTIKRKDIELFLIFFKNDMNNQEFIEWFNKLTKYHEKEIEKFFTKKEIKDDGICANGLTVEFNKEIFEPLIKKAITIGYFDEESKKIFLQYYSKEKIMELEQILFGK